MTSTNLRLKQIVFELHLNKGFFACLVATKSSSSLSRSINLPLLPLIVLSLSSSSSVSSVSFRSFRTHNLDLAVCFVPTEPAVGTASGCFLRRTTAAAGPGTVAFFISGADVEV
jgi:hypothetical protein